MDLTKLSKTELLEKCYELNKKNKTPTKKEYAKIIKIESLFAPKYKHVLCLHLIS